jgi:hypothetical protein
MSDMQVLLKMYIETYVGLYVKCSLLKSRSVNKKLESEKIFSGFELIMWQQAQMCHTCTVK